MRRCLHSEGIVDVYHFSIKKSNIYPMHTTTHTHTHRHTSSASGGAVNSAHVSDDNIPKMDDQWF